MKILFVFALRGGTAIFTLLFNIVLARMLGAEGAGLFTLAYSVVLVASIIARFGMDRSLLRKVAAHVSMDEWEPVRSNYLAALQVSLLLSGAFAVLMFVLSPLLASAFNKPELSELMRWMALTVPPFTLLFLHAEAVKGLKRVNISLLLSGIAIPAFSMLGLFALGSARGVIGAAAALLMASILSALIGAGVWLRLTRSHWPRHGEPVSRPALMRESLPLLVENLVGRLDALLLVFMIGLWASSADVARFNAAVKGAMALGMMLQAVNAYFSPRCAALYHQNEIERLQQLSQKMVRLLALLAVPVMLLILLFPQHIMSAFGPEFVTAAPLLVVLSLGQFVNLLTGPVGPLLTMSDYSVIARNNAILGTGISLVLGVALFPFMGVMGAALALSTALVVKNLVGVMMVKRHLGISLLK